MKRLTDKGVDEVIDINIPEKKQEEKETIEEKPAMLPRKEAQEKAIKMLNGGKVNTMYGLRTMKKTTFIGLWIAFGFVMLILIIGGIWGIVTIKNKDFAPKVSNENTINVDSPNVTVPILNNYTTKNINNITINIDLGEELLDSFSDELINIINNKTNST